ncbi:hypothetical protein DM860_010373 [Cuscuta australis]|uniref:Carbonic anhydrase n=1 Tax=Cuscuta australis TaxID=267555 RepID=A0A328E0Z6_9ASTE|nr:hypothetical protein DM860_010373 [Cuscuta australis]
MRKLQSHHFQASFLLAAILCFFLLPIHYSTQAQEVEDEREFDYSEKGEKGPRRWGELKKEWEACKNGDMQSPVDVSHVRVNFFRKPAKKAAAYKAANATVKNRGHDISVEWHGGDAGSFILNRKRYSLRAAHWHSPSEHTLRGKRYELEMHALHTSTDPESGKNSTAVIAVLYKIGKPNSFLSKLMEKIASMIDQKDQVREAGLIDPKELGFVGAQKYYTYLGSLTTPPCTQGVVWTINKKVKTVSRKQVKLLREAVHDFAERNARPLQERNGREIRLLLPSSNANP